MDTIFTGEIRLGTLIAALVILLVFELFKNVFIKIITGLMRKLSERYKLRALGFLVEALEKPLKSFFAYTGVYFALALLPFRASIALFLYRLFRSCIIITAARVLLNVVNLYSVAAPDTPGDRISISKTIFPLISKVVKVLIIIVAAVAIAAEFEFRQLNSLLAGVGIGGAAIALASQDMLKNFFGGFVVLTDKSFEVGDFINVGGSEGTVEELGLRSTKIRTLEQELIVMPNAKFADGAVINYSRRQLRRASFTLGATYGTSAEAIRTVISRIKSMLENHPDVKDGSPLVKFENFGASSLNIRVQYLIDTSDYGKYMSVMDEINFSIMDIFETEGVSFAFPSMSLYMEKDAK